LDIDFCNKRYLLNVRRVHSCHKTEFILFDYSEDLDMYICQYETLGT